MVLGNLKLKGTCTGQERSLKEARTHIALFIKLVEKSSMTFAQMHILGSSCMIGRFAYTAQNMCACNVANLFFFAPSGLETGCFFVMGSGVGQYHALWKGPLRDDEGNFMAVDTLPCGLILLSVACCAACGVFTHVASHGAGAVSRETRFLYRRKTLEVSAMMRPSTTGREPGLDRIKNLT
ncbi:hypothetical protein C0Q70_04865 [Pomacea canaliculata]|uniref:Uncharacterized protein n=1 Tax=Pomacea canaliculata TaxID=400727 RepID=A0A2T7PJP1_POMCA|nr:hypothetical protein C0Q70_04865 [Pomacea canaliculata]